MPQEMIHLSSLLVVSKSCAFFTWLSCIASFTRLFCLIKNEAVVEGVSWFHANRISFYDMESVF